MASESKTNSKSSEKTKSVYRAPEIKCISSDLNRGKRLEINACNSGFGSGPVEKDTDQDSDGVTY